MHFRSVGSQIAKMLFSFQKQIKHDYRDCVVIVIPFNKNTVVGRVPVVVNGDGGKR
jgi:hypothetical protein